MPRAVKHAAPRAAEHAAPRDRSAEHAAARTLDALPTFVGKPFVPLEAELKNPKRLDETERRLDAWLKRQEREHHNPNRTRIALADSENGIDARRKKACAEAPRTPITPAAVKAATACAA